MKTLNFLEALAKLSAGECKGIRPSTENYHYIKIDAAGDLSWQDDCRIIYVPALLKDWTLVDEKPTPLPWSKPEHVPGPVCWIKFKGSGSEFMVTSISESGIAGVGWSIFWNDIKDRVDSYSTDRVTWKPCLIEP